MGAWLLEPVVQSFGYISLLTKQVQPLSKKLKAVFMDTKILLKMFSGVLHKNMSWQVALAIKPLSYGI